MKSILPIVFLFFTGVLLHAQCSPAVSCTFSETDLIGHSGTFVIDSNEVLCIEHSFCLGTTATFPTLCTNSGASSIINHGRMVICPGVRFEFSGSIQNLGIIQQLGGDSELIAGGTIDCNNGEIQVTTPGLTNTCTEVTGINGTATSFCFNSSSSCGNNSSTSYCPWASGPVGGLTISGICLIEGYPSDEVLLSLSFQQFEVQPTAAHTHQLSWQTRDGHAWDQFEVQRSVDGIHFNALATITQPSNEEGDLFQYVYEDVQPLQGPNYYRIAVKNADGSTTLSPVRVETFNNSTQPWQVYPIPAKDQLHIQHFQQPIHTISIRNTAGQLVSKHKVNTQDTTIPIHALSSGTYLLHIELQGGIYFSKVIQKE